MVGRYAVLLLAGLAAQPAWAAKLRSGDYLDTDFVKALRATRSPYLALQAAGQGPQLIRVERDANGLRFTGNLNWHEGWTIFTLTPQGTMQRGEEARDYPKPQIVSDHSFRFNEGRPGSSWHTYAWVGDADQAVVASTLAGRYSDPSGHVIEFGADGVLRGIGPDTRFWLDNDHVENHFDYFYFGKDQNAPSALAFELHGPTLLICSLLPAEASSPGIGQPDCKHPRFVLRRLQPTMPPL